MIRTLHVENFTVFSDAEFDFGALNVIHGENSTGKTHVLKLLYSLLATLKPAPNQPSPESPTKSWLEPKLAEVLAGVFRPDEDKIGRLARRQHGRSTARVRVELDTGGSLAFTFSSQHDKAVKVDEVPTAWIQQPPIYLPTRELLSVYPGFVSLFETRAIPFDKTWRDTCAYLGAAVARGPKRKEIAALLKPLEEAIGCQAELKGDRFYVTMKEPKAAVEADMVAEGLRKLTMVARLIANGSLDDKGSLFWDEPEANLNPALIREVAPILLKLAAGGVQVFTATHSLFLLVEIDLLLRARGVNPAARFTGLTRGDDGIVVTAGSDLAASGDVAALREELEQSDRQLPSKVEI